MQYFETPTTPASQTNGRRDTVDPYEVDTPVSFAPIASVGPKDSRAVLSALRALQEKIRRLEAERAQSEGSYKALEREVTHYQELLERERLLQSHMGESTTRGGRAATQSSSDERGTVESDTAVSEDLRAAEERSRQLERELATISARLENMRMEDRAERGAEGKGAYRGGNGTGRFATKTTTTVHAAVEEEERHEMMHQHGYGTTHGGGEGGACGGGCHRGGLCLCHHATLVCCAAGCGACRCSHSLQVGLGGMNRCGQEQGHQRNGQGKGQGQQRGARVDYDNYTYDYKSEEQSRHPPSSAGVRFADTQQQQQQQRHGSDHDDDSNHEDDDEGLELGDSGGEATEYARGGRTGGTSRGSGADDMPSWGHGDAEGMGVRPSRSTARPAGGAPVYNGSGAGGPLTGGPLDDDAYGSHLGHDGRRVPMPPPQHEFFVGGPSGVPVESTVVPPTKKKMKKDNLKRKGKKQQKKMGGESFESAPPPPATATAAGRGGSRGSAARGNAALASLGRATVSSAAREEGKTKKRKSGVQREQYDFEQELPFVVGRTGRSYSVSANVQQVLALLKHHVPSACDICDAPGVQRLLADADAETHEELGAVLAQLQRERDRLVYEQRELIGARSSSHASEPDLERAIERLGERIRRKKDLIATLRRYMKEHAQRMGKSRPTSTVSTSAHVRVRVAERAVSAPAKRASLASAIGPRGSTHPGVDRTKVLRAFRLLQDGLAQAQVQWGGAY